MPRPGPRGACCRARDAELCCALRPDAVKVLPGGLLGAPLSRQRAAAASLRIIQVRAGGDGVYHVSSCSYLAIRDRNAVEGSRRGFPIPRVP
jgi:hypothetical protein